MALKNSGLSNPLILLPTALFFLNCTVSKQKIKALNLIVNYPVVQTIAGNLHVFNLSDTISIYYSKDYIVYKLAPIRQLETDQRIKGSEPYFIYQNNSKTGTLFDSIRQTGIGTKVSVDSILFNRAYTGMKSDFTDASWKKMDSIRDKQSLIEKFAPRTASTDPTNIDSAFFYYTAELKDYDYSFSKKADSLTNLKLYQLRCLYKAKLTSDNKLFQARELFFKIEKKDISDADSVILNLVNRYENILRVK